MEAPMPSFSRALHIALTARDMRVSADWYQHVLGSEFVKEFQVAPGDAGIPRILLLHQHSGFLLSLCGHPDRSGDAFDPRHTGIDHIAFEVAELGVAHSPVRELGHSCFVSLEDPDRVQIELWLTITPHLPAASR
jgi:glyoxylase I family protein